MSKKIQALQKVMQMDLSYNETNKAAFKKTSTAFLRDIGKKMNFQEMKVSFNPGGVAVAGDPSLYGMWSDGNGLAVYINGDRSGGTTDVMYRAITNMKDYRGDRNRWTSLDVGEEGLLESFLQLKQA